MTAIEVHGLVKRYAGRAALDGIDLHVDDGETVALLGPNGSGKTTLMRVLAGMTTPTAGTVRLAGHDVVRARRRAARATGMVGATEHTWYLRLTGRENLELFAGVLGLRPRAARDAALAGLAEVGLGDQADVRVGAYSRGMRARLAIARGRMGRPSILLLDEPSANLDVAGADTLAELLRRRDHRAALIATHAPEEAAAVADRAVVLHAGRVAHEIAGPVTAEAVAAALREQP